MLFEKDTENIFECDALYATIALCMYVIGRMYL